MELMSELMSGLASPLIGPGSSIFYSSTTATLTDVSAGPITWLNGETGEILTVGTETPLYIPNWGFVSAQPRVEMLTYPTDPSGWTNVGLQDPTASGVVIGDFAEYIVTDDGATWHRSEFYDSTLHGNPTDTQQFCLLYNFGTSADGTVYFYDSTGVLVSRIDWDGSAWGAGLTDAGTPKVIADIECSCGFRALLFSMDWTNPSNTLGVGISPNSDDNSNILAYGANAYESDHNMFPLFADAPGAITTRAGTTSQDDISDLPKLLGALDGFVTGSVLNSGNLIAVNRYEVIATEPDHFGTGVVAGDRVSGLTTALDANNTVKLVAPASCVIEGPLKIGFDPTDRTSRNRLLTINSTTAISISDITGSVYVANNGLFSDTVFAPGPRITYQTRVVKGDYLGTQSFQCQIQDTDGTWYGGTIQAADDHWSPDDDKIVWCDANSWLTGYTTTIKPNNGEYWI